MTQDVQAWKKKSAGGCGGPVALLVLLAIVVMPPLGQHERVKSRITQLLSDRWGGRCGLSSVELRLLPLPGFVLTDLTVEERPCVRGEPVLHATRLPAPSAFYRC